MVERFNAATEAFFSVWALQVAKKRGDRHSWEGKTLQVSGKLDSESWAEQELYRLRKNAGIGTVVEGTALRAVETSEDAERSDDERGQDAERSDLVTTVEERAF